MADMLPIIKESFGQYAGAVLQSRALVDVRDCLKPSARQIFYCLYTDKFIHSKPFKKTLKAIGSAMRMYIHGDSSCEGIIMRSGQPFAMRYPLMEVEGSYGTLAESGNWAAARYTASRLSSIANLLFEDIQKDTIFDWQDNYDDTEKYPMVLTSKGFYNIVNGTMGIGIGAASSLPQFNIKDVNEALIKLLWNKDIADEELICMPDFATGAILLNADEVKESLKNGHGKSCILRSVVEYDEKDRCLIVKEIPYGVYTNTICGQLEEIINLGGSGIDRFNDLTGTDPLIKIYLSKGANPEKVLRFLFKETSLQYYYGINMTMLDNGRFPRVFTWKEALNAHLTHEFRVYREGFCFDLRKIKARLHIIEGLLKAIDMIDEVVATIKQSADSRNASIALQRLLLIDEVQAKAILDIKLARLAHLEISKLLNEQNDLNIEKDRIESILTNETLFRKEIENGLREVIKKYGDARRTQIMNLKVGEDDEEPIEEKTIIINLTNKGTLYASESTTLMTQKRGGRGTQAKLGADEHIVNSINELNINTLLLFTNKGKVYSTLLDNIPLTTPFYPQAFFNMEDDEYVCNLCSFSKTDTSEYIVFTTKSGMVKKSSLSEYKIKKGKGVVAIKLKPDDVIIDVSFTTKDNLGILTRRGNFVRIDTTLINPIGRVAAGVSGIKLNEGDEVVSAHLIPEATTELITVSSAGLAKSTSILEYPLATRATKGSMALKFKDGDLAAYFLPINGTENELIVVSSKGTIKIPISQIARSGRNTVGTQLKKMVSMETIQTLIKNGQSRS